jgi:hypothetical protein
MIMYLAATSKHQRPRWERGFVAGVTNGIC